MIVMGDEVRRTQHGNNNAYCHDNAFDWFDWSLVEKHADLHRFVRLLLQSRLQRNVEDEQHRISLSEMIARANKAWHGVKLNQPDWSQNSRSFALCVEMPKDELLFHLIFNSHWEPLEFELPPLQGGTRWQRWIDTFLPTPSDICDWGSAGPIPEFTYSAGPRSVVVLLTQADAS